MTVDAFRQNRSAAKRVAILNAALALFRRDGFSRAVMEDIAREAEVSTATLYRHFSSKEALFEAVALDSLAAMEPVLQQTGGAPAERLRDLARAYALLLARPETRGVIRMLIAETGAGGALAERFYGSVKTRVIGAFVSALEAAAEAGVVRFDGPGEPVAGQLQGMIEHATLMRGLILGDHAPGVAEPEALADAALATWLARYGSAP